LCWIHLGGDESLNLGLFGQEKLAIISREVLAAEEFNSDAVHVVVGRDLLSELIAHFQVHVVVLELCAVPREIQLRLVRVFAWQHEELHQWVGCVINPDKATIGYLDSLLLLLLLAEYFKSSFRLTDASVCAVSV